MLNIFSLEDDLFQQGRLERAVAACVQSGQIRYRHFETFGKPDQLLAAIKETGNHNLFFLDIEIRGEEKKGMEIAREIRAKDPNAVIVFVTTHSEFMPLTYRYRVAALDFIDKGLTEPDFNQAVAEVLTHVYNNSDNTVASDAFVYKTEHSHIQVPFSDILYFETSPTVHKVILTTKKGHMEFYGKVSEIAKSDPRLYQSHRAFVVNPENITEVDRVNMMVHFETGDSCLVSRLKVKGLIERLVQNG
ncbi:two-component system response regulator AgrA [Streptococcus rupicaprae]|uniref:Two-component system response regulator AgrA n=1 Tax=Streptococcus rupicaprae TaxID=759619 RepID=A0ABV2FK18_9STRE